MARQGPPTAAARSQTIERAALILAFFSASEPHLKLAEIAAKLDLNPSTAYRYVATLEAAGLLQRDEQQGGYRLGLRVIELAGVALNQVEVRKHAVDEMDRLRDELELLINLGVLLDGDVLHLEHSAPRHVPRLYTSLGRRAVAHCTSLGKVLLSELPWDAVRAMVERFGWRPYTPQSIQDFDRLREELVRVREQGYAVDNEERRRGVYCLAVPIRGKSGTIEAALSASGTLALAAPERQAAALGRLTNAAHLISLRLGYAGDSV